MKKIILVIFVLLNVISAYSQSSCGCAFIANENFIFCDQSKSASSDCVQGNKRYLKISKGSVAASVIQIDAFTPIFYIKDTDLKGLFTISEISKITLYACSHFPMSNDIGDECNVPIITGLQDLSENTNSNLRFDKNTSHIVYTSPSTFSKAKLINSSGVTVKSFSSLTKGVQSDYRLSVNDISSGLYIVIFDDEVNLGKILVY